MCYFLYPPLKRPLNFFVYSFWNAIIKTSNFEEVTKRKVNIRILTQEYGFEHYSSLVIVLDFYSFDVTYSFK